LLAGAITHLNPGGALLVEVGDSEAAVAAAWPELPFLWLEFEHGGGGVFLITREELLAAQARKAP
jgi:ribosomal protein L3 glutamine methyltransferase